MYNEADNIADTVQALVAVMADFAKPWEIIFVNDGSADNTLEAALGWEKQIPQLTVLSYPVNCGRGRALRTGLNAARGRYVVTIDFDLSYSPDHILRLYQALTDSEKESDIVLGSAYMPGGTVEGVSASRLVISRLGNKILERSFPQVFKTSTCVLRGYRRHVLHALELCSDGKEIHLEILSKACALGFRITEIPAHLRNRKKGKSKFRFRRTSISHLVFLVFEKPIMIFGLAGMAFSAAGGIIGIYVVWLRFFGALNPNRPLIPLMTILLVMGSQLFCFAFIAAQNQYLRNEVYKLQKQVRIMHRNGIDGELE